jgi:hypothetical protein
MAITTATVGGLKKLNKYLIPSSRAILLTVIIEPDSLYNGNLRARQHYNGNLRARQPSSELHTNTQSCSCYCSCLSIGALYGLMQRRACRRADASTLHHGLYCHYSPRLIFCCCSIVIRWFSAFRPTVSLHHYRR